MGKGCKRGGYELGDGCGWCGDYGNWGDNGGDSGNEVWGFGVDEWEFGCLRGVG